MPSLPSSCSTLLKHSESMLVAFMQIGVTSKVNLAHSFMVSSSAFSVLQSASLMASSNIMSLLSRAAHAILSSSTGGGSGQHESHAGGGAAVVGGRVGKGRTRPELPKPGMTYSPYMSVTQTQRSTSNFSILLPVP